MPDRDPSSVDTTYARLALARALFAPGRIALIGASDDPEKLTSRPARVLRHHGFRGEVVTIIFESYVPAARVKRAFHDAGLDSLVHAQTPGEPWPTLRELIELAGGVPDGREIQAVLLGGAAGSFVRGDELDLPLTFEAVREAKTTLGSGVCAT